MTEAMSLVKFSCQVSRMYMMTKKSKNEKMTEGSASLGPVAKM